ncbi:tripartite tricarboxylate transporter TctB family protein [Paracoccus sp. TK19116]|uniref:Tripartite tricarboxylate transporter TctB family protein n=1 Tax=Paracoccus albicereus TaxID=2922394 RepID=A0ABT1MZ01_9RHOB|nr:tripartite tricarboxylate transporter TctB family protein [Paracoccus albicereus]MCQ0972091.1 tripartite tricarboxylate transporter TctB family protein [Paracoccus albicereus]
MFTLTKDRAFALAVLALVATMYVASLDIRPATSWQPYGSAFYPRLLLGVVGLLAVLLLIRSFLPSAPVQTAMIPALVAFVRTNPRVPALFLVFAAYVAMMPVTGYLLATMGFLILSFLLLSGFSSRRIALVSLILVIAVPLIVFFVFENILSIRLP